MDCLLLPCSTLPCPSATLLYSAEPTVVSKVFSLLSHSSTMASTSYYPYATTSSLPLSVPGKGVQTSPYGRQISSYGHYSASPPERPASISSSSGAGLYSSASSQYASSEYDSSAGATSVDLLDYMNDRLAQAYNPVPQDRSMARQAQM